MWSSFELGAAQGRSRKPDPYIGPAAPTFPVGRL